MKEEKEQRISNEENDYYKLEKKGRRGVAGLLMAERGRGGAVGGEREI